MSNLTDIHPKVFISYAWANNNTTSFVLNLAKRLVQHGVEVVLDRWSLKEGQDKYSFMEKTVNDASITNVLLVCDKAYKERADARRGGVGDETTVITPEIYGNASQTKFIPILLERDDNGNDYLPAYIKSRLYVDFFNENGYCENDFEYYDFFIWESFIGTIALLWKHEQYSAIYDLISKKIFFT